MDAQRAQAVVVQVTASAAGVGWVAAD